MIPLKWRFDGRGSASHLLPYSCFGLIHPIIYRWISIQPNFLHSTINASKYPRLIRITKNYCLRKTLLYIDLLQKHSWKGNVRELKNSIERSLILIEGDTLDANALPYEFCMQEGTSNSLSAMALAEIERKHIQKVLAFTKGNKAEAARLLEIGVATLYRKIEEYKI